MLSFMEADEAHLSRCEQEGNGIQTYTVPYRSLNNILAHSGLDHIDLLSIDIEGGEVAALSGLDWKRWSPCIIVAEANNRTNFETLDNLLQVAGYQFVSSIGCNGLWRKRGEPSDGR